MAKKNNMGVLVIAAIAGLFLLGSGGRRGIPGEDPRETLIEGEPGFFLGPGGGGGGRAGGRLAPPISVVPTPKPVPVAPPGSVIQLPGVEPPSVPVPTPQPVPALVPVATPRRVTVPVNVIQAAGSSQLEATGGFILRESRVTREDPRETAIEEEPGLIGVGRREVPSRLPTTVEVSRPSPAPPLRPLARAVARVDVEEEFVEAGEVIPFGGRATMFGVSGPVTSFLLSDAQAARRAERLESAAAEARRRLEAPLPVSLATPVSLVRNAIQLANGVFGGDFEDLEI